MKSQIIPISFLLLSVGLIIIGFIFYNVFYGKKYEEGILEIKILDAARNVIENAKNYLKLSLVYSSLQAMREQASSGGSVGAGPWICNGPNPLPVEISKGCLENYTKYYLTIYGSKFNTTIPLNVYLKDFSSLIYQLEESGVFSGLYDEGNFTVNATGARISVTKDELRVSEEFNISELITKNRFWYMFRVFTQWANEDPFSPCICAYLACACSSTSQEEECTNCQQYADACAEYALKVLQSKFDEYVKCEKANICCAQGIGPSCLEPTECIPWSNRCGKKCEHNCTPPYPYTSYASSHSFYTPTFFPNRKISFQGSDQQTECKEYDCKAYYWYEARFSAAYIFTCKDYKYYISSPKGPKPLTFSVAAYAYLRDQDRCKALVKCECPPSATKCEECTPKCTPCFGEIRDRCTTTTTSTTTTTTSTTTTTTLPQQCKEYEYWSPAEGKCVCRDEACDEVCRKANRDGGNCGQWGPYQYQYEDNCYCEKPG
jgi:hypothetical protein